MKGDCLNRWNGARTLIRSGVPALFRRFGCRNEWLGLEGGAAADDVVLAGDGLAVRAQEERGQGGHVLRAFAHSCAKRATYLA